MCDVHRTHQRIYEEAKIEIAKEKAAFVMGQIRTMREDPPHCRCYCGMEIYIPLVFKCLYCGEYYCQPCAEEHFGKTRAEWAKEEPELEQALQDAKL